MSPWALHAMYRFFAEGSAGMSATPSCQSDNVAQFPRSAARKPAVTLENGLDAAFVEAPL